MGALEAGVKLLPFLQRALPDQSPSCLHKWIRSGQVRVNGRRARAFDVLAEGDCVRLPPFARPLIFAGTKSPSEALPDLGPGLDVAFAEKDFLLLSKAGGLPAQGGSGHSDSVAARLSGAFVGAGHIPAPVHRLDRDTSGLLLAGRSMAAQKKLHRWLRSGLVLKDYLAWVRGAPAWTGARLLIDRLEIRTKEPGGREYTACLPGGQSLEAGSAVAQSVLADFLRAKGEAGEKTGREAGGKSGPETGRQREAARPGGTEPGRLALCLALPVMTLERAALDALFAPNGNGPCARDAAGDLREQGAGSARFERSALSVLSGEGAATLFLLRLVTGRKHQLRVQLASRGLPILGDRRYGERFSGDFPLLLHAWRLRLPQDEETGNDEAAAERRAAGTSTAGTSGPAGTSGTAGISGAAGALSGRAPSAETGAGYPAAFAAGAAPREYRLASPWPAPFLPDAQSLEAAASSLDCRWSEAIANL